MAATVWTVEVDGQEHKVELVHRWATGIRRVKVDGEVVHRVREWFTSSNVFRVIPVLNERGQVWIVTGATSYTYYLMVDGRPAPSERDKRRGIDAQRLAASRGLSDWRYWGDLADRLGFTYTAMSGTAWKFQHRLVGQIGGRPVMVFTGINGKGGQPALYASVRHAPVPDLAAYAKPLIDNPRLQALVPEQKGKSGAVQATGQETSLVLSYGRQKLPVEELAKRIQAFAEIVDAHAPAFISERCDQCGMSRAPTTVLVGNTVLRRLCQGCIDKSEEEGRAARRRYEAEPARLVPGAFAGLAVSLLLSPVWAALIVLLDRVGAFMAIGVFVAILVVMDRVKTRRTLPSIFVAGLLVLPSVFLSTWLAFLWTAWQEGYQLTSTLLRAIAKLTLTSELLSMQLFFAAIGILFVVVAAWRAQRKVIRETFHPKMEFLSLPGQQGRRF